MYNSGANQSSATNVYGLSLKSRAISQVSAESDLNRFLVGTQALKEDNEICLIEEKENEGVKCVAIYAHPKEIWSITSCTFDANQLFTVYNTGAKYSASLWSMDTENSALDEVCELKGHTGYIKPILCDPSGSSDYVVSLDDTEIRLWSNITTSSPTVLTTFGRLNKLTAGCINPNKANQLATANDVNIKGWDFRSGKESFAIDKAHSDLIRDIDFNPNNQYYMLSAGDDCKLKFWDTRQTKEPLRIFAGHDHWIWNAKYNKYHDQLVITSSSDHKVKLWHAYTISSAVTSEAKEGGDNADQPAPQPTSGKKNKRKEDKLIKTFEEHEDSVYGVCWGSSGFNFASLSYDGRVVINNVPKEYCDLLTME
ncbi:hypothetical protein SAMD00019534_115140 [Acytostelium subglobosum LB1]|uniref:hypothetical protein n=1 Tax=Acytostelium subglobosum LB1 TaxID=1410327 RepID=UPI000645043D|nr:hypothetical protein SAMD00019534_115140 [Acytostelium subglobosum LB1]GAM28338.1 hypothetical protein SAMD00019534_115140 [Acytostelium subglobosum LB1]|eukprot:XP_012748655.1 hypothetical protein SAMD00019534_115140 [Acytostelium subglobosum LB1]